MRSTCCPDAITVQNGRRKPTVSSSVKTGRRSAGKHARDAHRSEQTPNGAGTIELAVAASRSHSVIIFASLPMRGVLLALAISVVLWAALSMLSGPRRQALTDVETVLSSQASQVESHSNLSRGSAMRSRFGDAIASLAVPPVLKQVFPQVEVPFPHRRGAMKSFNQYVVIAAGITLLSLTLIATNAGQVVAQQKPLDVNVINTTATPVPVFPLSTRELHQVSNNATFSDPFFNFTIEVPTGKRLIIESASVRLTLPAGDVGRASVSGNFQSGLGSQYLSLNFQGTFNGHDVYTTTQPVRLYVNSAGGFFNVVRTGTGTVFAEVSIAGYLEPAP
jgi:hypothetical protein